MEERRDLKPIVIALGIYTTLLRLLVSFGIVSGINKTCTRISIWCGTGSVGVGG